MKKRIVLLTMVVVFTLAMSMTSFAATDVNTVMTTAFQTVVDDILEMAGGVLPIALGVMGFSVSVLFGVKWFKKLTGASGS